MALRRRIYLDHAATSWPKSAGVVDAVTTYLRDNGAPAGRGGYREAIEVERCLSGLRGDLARLIQVAEPARIVFTLNGTDALNLAIHGLARSGDHVLTTDAEHNSVLRPLAWLAERRGVQIERVPCDGWGRVDPDAVRRRLRPGQTRLVAIIHASNVTGAVQPIDEIGTLARSAGALVLVDAAQSLGHWPLDVGRLPIDLLAAPGHKGLGGPLGTGFLYIAPGVERHLEPHRQGGTGTHSDDERQPESLPDRYESGNHNVPGLVGLAAAVRGREVADFERLAEQQRELTVRAIEGLRGVAGVRVFAPPDVRQQVGVLSLTIEGLDPQETAATLDSAFGIQTRAGLHCAPRIHRAMGTLASGGTVRLSWGGDTTVEIVDQTIAAIAELAASV